MVKSIVTTNGEHTTPSCVDQWAASSWDTVTISSCVRFVLDTSLEDLTYLDDALPLQSYKLMTTNIILSIEMQSASLVVAWASCFRDGQDENTMRGTLTLAYCSDKLAAIDSVVALLDDISSVGDKIALDTKREALDNLKSCLSFLRAWFAVGTSVPDLYCKSEFAVGADSDVATLATLCQFEKVNYYMALWSPTHSSELWAPMVNQVTRSYAVFGARIREHVDAKSQHDTSVISELTALLNKVCKVSVDATTVEDNNIYVHACNM